MTRQAVRGAARWAYGAAAWCLAGAALAATGLTRHNFVDIGDTVVDMLNTSGLAFSTLVIGQGGDSPFVHTGFRRAAFEPSAPLPITHPFDSPCPGGGRVSGSMRDSDASGDLSVRDRFVTIFDACRIDGALVTGRSEFTVASHRVEGPVEVTELDFVFKELGTDTLRWSGPARVSLMSDRRSGGDRYVVTYRDLAVKRFGLPYRWNFTLDVRRPPLGDDTASLDGSMSAHGMTLQLSQDEPFVFGAQGTPRAGRVTVSDAQGSRLVVEAERRRFSYRLYLHGHRPDVPDAQSFGPYQQR